MEINAEGAAVRIVVPLTVPTVAVIVAVPAPTVCARPIESMVAIDVASEDQAAVLVKSCIAESVYVPVAVNCCVVPRAIDGSAGLTVMSKSSAEETASVVDPYTDPEVAVMFVEPAALLVAKPKLPTLSLMVATAAFDELH
jgi:hypothetical protein